MRITMEVNKVFAKVGDELSYTVQIENTNPDEMQEICLLSSIPRELKLVSGTLQVEHAKVDGGLSECIRIGNILPYETKKVTYYATVQDIPVTATLINIVDISYKDAEGKPQSLASNTVLTLVNDPNMRCETGGICLQSEQQSIDRKDEIIYWIELENKGNTGAENVTLTNLVPEYMEVITPVCAGDEIFVGQIGIGERKKITYKARLKNVPSVFEIHNKVEVNYDFMLPDRTPVHKVCASNEHQILIQTAYFEEEGKELSYSVSKDQATICDRLMYQIQLENKGNKTAQEVRLGNLIPTGVKIVAGSFKVNAKKVDQKEYLEVHIGEIRGGEVAKITYEVEVESGIPLTNPISNQVLVDYTYESGGNKVLQSQWTEKATIEVIAAILETKYEGIVTTVDQEVATIEDEINYKLVLHNTGNQSAQDVVVKINDLPGAEICSEEWRQTSEGYEKVLDEAILAGGYHIEEVKFVVQELLPEAVLRQRCQVAYNYDVGEQVLHQQSDWSLEVVTTLYEASLAEEKGSSKSVDKLFAQLGEILTYKIILINQGNQVAQNVTWQEKLSEGAELLLESVKKDGIGIWDDIRQKAVLGDIEPQTPCILTYQVRVTSLQPAIIQTETEIGYNYEVGEERCKAKTTRLYAKQTQVQMAQMTSEEGGFCKTANKTSVTLGEVIDYTIKLCNTGNIPAYGIKLQEIGNLDNRLIEIEQLDVGEERVIAYQVAVADLAQGNEVKSQSVLSYSYQVGEEWRSSEEVSPQLISRIQDAYIHPDTGGMIQSVNQTFAKVGDILKYTLLIENQGNVEATEITIDLGKVEAGEWLHEQMLYVTSIKPGERLALEYSLKVTDIPQQGVISVQPVIQYAFQVEEGVWVTRSYESNACETMIRWAKLGYIADRRMFNIAEAAVGEEVGYQLEIINKGNVPIEQLILTEKISDKLQYVPGSIRVNDQPILEEEALRLTLPKLEAEESCHISFKLKVIGYQSTPVYINEIIAYYYVCDPTQIREIVSEQTTPMALKIVDAYVGTDTKGGLIQVDKVCVDIEDTLVYQFSVTNQGNVKALDVCYKVLCEPELEIDPEVLEKGVWIGELLVGETKVIRIAGKVLAIPESETVGIQGQLSYRFEKSSGQIISRKIVNQSQRTQIHTAGPSTMKSIQVNKSQEVLSDQEELLVIWQIINDGNQKMEDTVLSCSAEQVWALSCEKVWIDEIEYEGDWVTGIGVGEILPGECKEVKVQVRAQYIPQVEKISWQGTVSYAYQVIPGHAKQKKEVCTPPLEVVIRDAGLRQHEGVKLEVPQQSWRLEEVIPYALTIQNKGNTCAKNIHIQAHHAETLEKIEEAEWPTCITQMEPGEIRVIELKFQAKALGEQGGWVQAELTYEVEKIADATQTFVATTPKVSIALSSVDLRGSNVQKHITSEHLKLGEREHYEIWMKNTGNQIARGVKLYHDTQGHILVKNESISINGQNYHEGFEDNQLHIGELLPGEAVAVTFEGEAVQLTKGYYTDYTKVYYRTEGYTVQEETEAIISQVKVESPNLLLEVTPEKHTVLVGEEITYEVELTNEGNSTAYQISLSHILPPQLNFLPKTLQVRGKNIHNIQALEAIKIAKLEAGEVVTYKWQAYVAEKGEGGPSSISPQVSYQLGGEKDQEEQMQMGEPYTLQIQEADLEIQVKTSKGQTKLKEGDEDNIFVHLVNRGTVAIGQVKLEGQLAPGVIMLPGSFQVGEKNIGTISLEEGVNLGGLEVDEAISLNYKVRINEYYKSTLNNNLWFTYYFKTEEQEALRKKQVGPVSYEMRVVSPSIMHMTHENRVTLPYQMKGISQVSEIEVLAELISIKVREESTKQAGLKGVIRYTIHYIGEANEHQVLKGERFFLKEIKLLREVGREEKLEMNVEVEKISSGIVNPREMMIWTELSVIEG